MVKPLGAVGVAFILICGSYHTQHRCTLMKINRLLAQLNVLPAGIILIEDSMTKSQRPSHLWWKRVLYSSQPGRNGIYSNVMVRWQTNRKLDVAATRMIGIVLEVINCALSTF